MDARSRLEERFIRAAIRHRETTERGRASQTNRAADLLFRARRRLISSESGRATLTRLMGHPDDSVRSWAATFSLEFAPDMAEQVLRSMVGGQGVLALEAEMTLKLWREGRLRFPRR